MCGERVTDMKQKERRFNPYGLHARLGITLAASALMCILVFLLLNTGLDYMFSNYYERSGFERIHIEKQGKNLQKFITVNKVSSKNLNVLKKWEKKQPVILLELYADDQCIYSSIYDVPVSSLVLNEDIQTQDGMQLDLMDRQVTAYIYSDFTYRFRIIGTFISVITSFVLFILLFFYNNRKLIQYICRLNEEVQILEGGNLEYSVSEEGNDEITDLARSMNRMRITLQQQIENEQKLHQANRQLITEMSHDLRTPLTGIMLYLEILRSRHYDSEDQLQDYLEKIDAKAHHMKLLTDHLFEYSMQDIHQKQLEPQSLDEAFRVAIDSLVDDLKARGFSVETELEWKNCYVQVNPEYIHRIIENIVSNIEKYAEKKAVIRMDMIYIDKFCGFSVMNTISPDTSYVDSNGVGIDSIRTMMEEMKGNCNVEQTDTTFEMTLLFPIQ